MTNPNVFFVAGDIWIYKPSGRNQGKGIFLVDQTNALLKDNAKREDFKKRREGVIQRWSESGFLC